MTTPEGGEEVQPLMFLSITRIKECNNASLVDCYGNRSSTAVFDSDR